MAEWLSAAWGIVVAVVAAAATAVIGAWTLRGWLAVEFSRTRREMYVAMQERERINKERHEQNLSLNQHRHEENQTHLRRIYVALAHLGYKGPTD